MIKWYYKPSGNCPVQAEGWFMGKYFYFRSRGERAYIEFYNSKVVFDAVFDGLFIEPITRIVVHTTEEHMAGWLSHRFCTFLVYKGCFKFLLNRWFGY